MTRTCAKNTDWQTDMQPGETTWVRAVHLNVHSFDQRGEEPQRHRGHLDCWSSLRARKGQEHESDESAFELASVPRCLCGSFRWLPGALKSWQTLRCHGRAMPGEEVRRRVDELLGKVDG